MRRDYRVFASILAVSSASPAFAQRSASDPACARPLAQPIAHVPLPGSSFQALPSRDGCWIFASLTIPDSGQKPGIAVLRRSAGVVSLARVVPLETAPTGMIITHDGKLLIAAAGPRLAFLDVDRLTAGRADAVLGYLVEAGVLPGRIYVNVTRDDRVLFASDERAQTITVIDLAKARSSGFAATAVVGKIPVGNAPIELAFSPDERYLYTTSQALPPRFGWPIACRPEGDREAAPNHTQGAIIIVDVARARRDPAQSVVAMVPAGCNPVRLVLSPRGEVAYVSARGSDALLAFDTGKLLSDSAHARIAEVPVGTAPVGVAVFDSGRRVVVTNSNRFAGSANDQQPLVVVDATKLTAGSAAVLGTIPAGAFPRELRVTADGRTLLLTNFGSKTLEIVDLTRLTLAPRTP